MGSGALGDIGAQVVDLAQFVTGEWLTGVSGLLETFVHERPVADAHAGLRGSARAGRAPDVRRRSAGSAGARRGRAFEPGRQRLGPGPGASPRAARRGPRVRRAAVARAITLFSGQWADLPFEEVASLASGWRYDGLEIACWGDHLDPWRVDEPGYVEGRLEILDRHGFKVWTISNHLTGQAVCDDLIDARPRDMLPNVVWGTEILRGCGRGTSGGPSRARSACAGSLSSAGFRRFGISGTARVVFFEPARQGEGTGCRSRAEPPRLSHPPSTVPGTPGSSVCVEGAGASEARIRSTNRV